MIDLNLAITINRPPSEVFARLTDLPRWPEWVGNAVAVEPVAGGPLRAGSQFRQVSRGGQSGTRLVDITGLMPDQVLAIASSNYRAVFTLEPVPAGTRLSTRAHVHATGLAALVYTVFLRAWVRQDLSKLKALVETVPARAGAARAGRP